MLCTRGTRGPRHFACINRACLSFLCPSSHLSHSPSTQNKLPPISSLSIFYFLYFSSSPCSSYFISLIGSPLPGESESIETIEVSFESAQEVGNENEVTSPEVQDTRNQDVKSKRAKRSKDEEVEGIKVALQDIARALKEGNATYEKVKQKLPIPEVEIWKLLEDLKIERQLFNRAYLYLLDNPDRIRAVIGCPLDKRKELLLEMVFGSIGPSM